MSPAVIGCIVLAALLVGALIVIAWLLDQVERLRRYVRLSRDALGWCGGSADFAPGGDARVGWLAIAAPLLDREVWDL